MSRLHNLKCWPSAFKDVELGVKTFEFRKNDRDFRAGDTLCLSEWDPSSKDLSCFTGKHVLRKVTYCLCGGLFDVPVGYVIMAIVPYDPSKHDPPEDLT